MAIQVVSRVLYGILIIRVSVLFKEEWHYLQADIFWYQLVTDVIATASRDGNIHVYDLRDESSTSAVEQPKKRGKAQPILRSLHSPLFPYIRRSLTVSLWITTAPTGGDKQPVNVIKQAHGETGKKPKKGTPIVRSTSRSPTSLLYLPSRPHTLISAGTGDSALKLWDLRMHGSYTTKSSSVALDQSADPGLFSSLEDGTFSRKRSHGISSLVLGKEGDVIYALGTDNRCVFCLNQDWSFPLIHVFFF